MHFPFILRFAVPFVVLSVTIASTVRMDKNHIPLRSRRTHRSKNNRNNEELHPDYMPNDPVTAIHNM